MYVCMFVCQSRSGMQFSTDVLYQPRSIRRMHMSVTLWTSFTYFPTLHAHKATHSTLQASCIYNITFLFNRRSLPTSHGEHFPFAKHFALRMSERRKLQARLRKRRQNSSVPADVRSEEARCHQQAVSIFTRHAVNIHLRWSVS